MAKSNGRDLIINKDGSPIAAVTSKTVTVNGEPVDVTNDDSDAWRELLNNAGTRSIDISFEGYTDDDTLRAIALNPAEGSLFLSDVTIDYPDGGELACDFFFSSLEETGEHDGAVEFSGEMQSSGKPTYTAAT